MPKKQSQKTPSKRSKRQLSSAEIDGQQASQLPDREAMSLINANLAAPINAAVALNALSDNSTAIAIADQDAPINQGIG
jgi:hypothetical protein